MSRDDWFRRTTWTSQDERDFLSRLVRSRSAGNKAQYLRIQALTLAETKYKPHTLAAITLLQRLNVEYPESSEVEQAHLQLAHCHEHLGDIQEAIRYFRISLKSHLNFPNRQSGVFLDFPWFIVEHGLTDHYDEALTVLESAHLAFQVQFFKAATIRSRVARFRGNDSVALKWAHEALQAAGATRSQFVHHASLGIVGKEYMHIVRDLQKFAAAQQAHRARA